MMTGPKFRGICWFRLWVMVVLWVDGMGGAPKTGFPAAIEAKTGTS